MTYSYAFEKLEVWQKSRELVKDVYLITKDFPAEERFGLNSQLRRAAVSVCSNIAEGSTRWGKKDQARFYELAFGSLVEVLNQIILSQDLGFITEEEQEELRPKVEMLGRMLNSLRKAIRSPL